MGAPIKRGNGGFLNNQAGTIQGYSLEMKTGEIKKGERAGEDYKKYSLKALILPDGGKVVEQYLDGGFLYGDNVVSEDNQSIEGADDYALDGKTELGKFVISLIEGEGSRLPEESLGDLRSYSFLNGLRVKFARVRDEEETKRRGQRKDKKTGKLYDRDQLLCAEVLAIGQPVAATKAAGKAKAAGKPAAAKPAAAAKAAAVPTFDPNVADAALVTIVSAAADQVIATDKIGGEATKYAVKQKMSPADRESLRKMLASTEYLEGAAERGLIVLDGEGKDRTATYIEQEQAAA